MPVPLDGGFNLGLEHQLGRWGGEGKERVREEVLLGEKPEPYKPGVGHRMVKHVEGMLV